LPGSALPGKPFVLVRGEVQAPLSSVFSVSSVVKEDQPQSFTEGRGVARREVPAPLPPCPPCYSVVKKINHGVSRREEELHGGKFRLLFLRVPPCPPWLKKINHRVAQSKEEFHGGKFRLLFLRVLRVLRGKKDQPQSCTE